MKSKILTLVLAFVIISLFAAVNFKYNIIEKNCVGCGDCGEVCPVEAISIYNGKAVIDQEKCIKCDLCKKTCNYNAIRKLK